MLNLFKKTLTVCTHNGSFHADEVFACATLSIWADKNSYKLKIKRSRDPSEIEKADIVVDVGMVYDPKKMRFDHHQKGGAGEHQNGIPYASFGLVWKHYGENVCASKQIAYMIEQKLVIPIDALDNGINTTRNLKPDVPEYRVMKEMVYAFRPDFFEFLDVAKRILNKEIRLCKDTLGGEILVEEEMYKQNGPEILILEDDLPWERVASKIKKIKAVVYPEPDQNAWCGENVRDNLNDYDSHRMQFPDSWRGLRDKQLEEASGVAGSLFCHRAGFLVVNKTKEGVLQMIKKALQEAQN